MQFLRTMILDSRLLAAMCLVVAIVTSSQSFAKATVRPGDSGVERELRFKEGDENGNDMKALKTEILVMKSEKRALDQLFKLSKKYKGTRMEPEILYRLAEIHMRRARSERFFEIHRSSENIVTVAPKLVSEASEAAKIREAIAYYQTIEEKFPRYHSMDAVLFNHAYAHQQIGEDPSAEKLLGKLVEKFPDSQMVPDAQLAMGEIAFKARRFQDALVYFDVIRKYPRARVYPYGLYKMAWTHYNLQNAGAGIGKLEEVVVYGRQVAANGWDAKLDLRKEALGDLALFFSDVGKADEAVDYFLQQAKDLDAAPYVMKLVDLYQRHARYKEVETLLRSVIAKMPQSEAIPEAHEGLIWNFDRTKNHSGAIAQLEALHGYCGDLASSQKPKENSPKIGSPSLTCKAKVNDISRKLASKWHVLWKKAYGLGSESGAEELSRSAEKSYRLYFQSVAKNDKETPNVRFAFAELLFALKKHREASDVYGQIADDRKSGLQVDQRIAHDAAYGAILSLEKSTSGKWSDEDESKLKKLSDAYIEGQPNGPYILDVRFQRALIAYEKERYEEAAEQFRKIGWDKKALVSGAILAEKVLRAQDLYLDILNIKKDFKAIKSASSELLAAAGGARVAQIEKIYREAYFSEVQLLEEQGKLQDAVDAYKKFALENTASELAPKAWWNASQLQFRLGDATGGADTCYQMYKLFPSSQNVKECLTKAGNAFESMGQLESAARVLLNLADVETEQQSHWRELSADFFALSGNQDRAFAMYLKLGESAPKAEKLRFLEKAAALAKTTGSVTAVQQIEEAFATQGFEPHSSQLVVEQAEASFDKGDFAKAFNLAKKIIAKEQLPKSLLARARFLQARVLEDEYRKQSVKTRLDRVGLVLAIKTEKLEKTQKAYQSAIRYGDPEFSVKSLQRLGDCYLDYGKTVRAMAAVTGLSAADARAFKNEVDALALPMEEKGIESVQQALETAKKAQLRGGQIADLQSALNRLNMKAETPQVVVSRPSIYIPQFMNASAQEVLR